MRESVIKVLCESIVNIVSVYRSGEELDPYFPRATMREQAAKIDLSPVERGELLGMLNDVVKRGLITPESRRLVGLVTDRWELSPLGVRGLARQLLYELRIDLEIREDAM